MLLLFQTKEEEEFSQAQMSQNIPYFLCTADVSPASPGNATHGWDLTGLYKHTVGFITLDRLLNSPEASAGCDSVSHLALFLYSAFYLDFLF